MPRLNKGFSCLNILQICDFKMNEEKKNKTKNQDNVTIVQVVAYRKRCGTAFQNSMRCVYGPLVSSFNTCRFPYVPCATATPASAHLLLLATAFSHRLTNWEYSSEPSSFPELEWYCILRPFTLPPRVACGMIRTSPGRSRIDTCLPLSVSLNFTFNSMLTG